MCHPFVHETGVAGVSAGEGLGERRTAMTECEGFDRLETTDPTTTRITTTTDAATVGSVLLEEARAGVGSSIGVGPSGIRPPSRRFVVADERRIVRSVTDREGARCYGRNVQAVTWTAIAILAGGMLGTLF